MQHKTIQKQSKKSDWINPDILNAKRIKRQYERIWRKSKTPLNRSNYTKSVHYFNRLVSKAKQKFYSDTISPRGNDSKTLWKSINKILHKIPELSLPQSSCMKNLAETFRTFLSKKSKKLDHLS